MTTDTSITEEYFEDNLGNLEETVKIQGETIAAQEQRIKTLENKVGQLLKISVLQADSVDILKDRVFNPPPQANSIRRGYRHWYAGRFPYNRSHRRRGYFRPPGGYHMSTLSDRSKVLFSSNAPHPCKTDNKNPVNNHKPEILTLSRETGNTTAKKNSDIIHSAVQ